MFCKWCGGKITSSDTKCGRCGREVPPLSDCGGFYDLVPGAKEGVKASPAAPAAEKQEKKVPVNTGADRHEPARKPRVDTKRNNQLLMAGAGALAMLLLILIMLLIISGRVNRNYREIQALKDSLAGAPVVESPNQSSEPDTPDLQPEDTSPLDTTPTDTTPLSTETDLPEDFRSITIRLVDGQTGPQAEGIANMGAGQVTMDVNRQEADAYFDGTTNWETTVSYLLTEPQIAGTLKIQYEYGNENGNVYLEHGLEIVPDSYRWQYRVGKGPWQDIEGKITKLDMKGENHLRFNLAELKTLAGDSEEPLKLRCVMTFANVYGDGFIMVVEDISTEKKNID